MYLFDFFDDLTFVQRRRRYIIFTSIRFDILVLYEIEIRSIRTECMQYKMNITLNKRMNTVSNTQTDSTKRTLKGYRDCKQYNVSLCIKELC